MSNLKLDHKRHIVKTISWRIIATTDTFFLSWFVTGNIYAGLSIGGLEVLTKMLLYYFHERIWFIALTNELKEVYNIDINGNKHKWYYLLYKKIFKSKQLKKSNSND